MAMRREFRVEFGGPCGGNGGNGGSGMASVTKLAQHFSFAQKTRPPQGL